MNDYEKGMARGRSQRHVMGRVRWLMLISILINLFLAYRLWEKSGELTTERTKSEETSVAIMSIKYEHAKCGKQNQQLSKDVEVNKMEVNELRENLETFKGEIRTCESQLADAGSDANKAKSENKELFDQKQALTAQFEKCSNDLSSSKELVKSLSEEVAKEKKEKEDALGALIASDPAKRQAGGNITTGNDQQAKDKAERNIPPVLNDIKTNNEAEVVKPREEIKSVTVEQGAGEEIEDVDKKDTMKNIAECAFEEGQHMENSICVYHDVESFSSRWQFEPSPLISSLVLTEKHENYLSVAPSDDLKTPAEAGLVLGPLAWDKCLEIVMNVLLVDTGMISVLHDEKELATLKTEEEKPSWQVKVVKSSRPPTTADNLIEVRGAIDSSGAVAVSNLKVNGIECPKIVDGVTNMDKEGLETAGGLSQSESKEETNSQKLGEIPREGGGIEHEAGKDDLEARETEGNDPPNYADKVNVF